MDVHGLAGPNPTRCSGTVQVPGVLERVSCRRWARAAVLSVRLLWRYATPTDIFAVAVAALAFMSGLLLAWPSIAASPMYALPHGTLNPEVTQSTISSTICRPGWTRTIRPPLSYTSKLKREQMRQRHLPGSPAAYEEDHFIPLELGGAPRNPGNLWPQPIKEAQRKNWWEVSLNRAVCAGRM